MAELTFDKATHEYRRDGIVLPHATGILSGAGLYKGSDWFTEEGRVFGGYVHQATEFYDRGTLNIDTLDPALAGALRSWQQFREATGFTPLEIEKILFCALGFAGTPDRWGALRDGRLLVLDIKTGTPQPCDPIQTALYQMLLEHNGFRVDVRGSVYLDRGGEMPAWRIHSERSDFAVAQALLTVHNFKRSKGLAA